MKKSQLKRLIREVIENAMVSHNKANNILNTWLENLQSTRVFNIDVSLDGRIVKFKLTDGGILEMQSQSPITFKANKHVNEGDGFDDEVSDEDRKFVDAQIARRRTVPGCKYCEENKFSRDMPEHDASPDCESGKKPHCTCDSCY